MGLGWSKRREDWQHPHTYHYPPPPPPPPLPPPPLPPSSSSSSSSSSAPSNPPIPAFSPPQPPGYSFAAGASYSPAPAPCFPHNQASQQPPYPSAVPYPPPAPPAGHAYRLYPQYPPPGAYANPARGVFPGRSGYQYYGPPGQGGGWWPPAPALLPRQGASSSGAASLMVPPPYVEHQRAVTIKNNVNLHKDTIRLERDEQNPDHHLVSFTFDSLAEGSITIFYFAKEGENCNFLPVYPDIFMPVSIPFEKGLGQKFCQPSGSGIDLGFFDLDDLSKPTQEDAFPLVVSAQACPEPKHTSDGLSQPPGSSRAQITQAVIEKKSDGQFQVKVIKQILWVDGERYELKEIFGLTDSAKTVDGDCDLGTECVICMTEPKDTAVLPCRHMCMCSECAKALRLQSNKCPICRQPVEELMEIKVNSLAGAEV